MTARAWIAFRLPSGSRCYVPADYEAAAITLLRRSQYKDAPVHEYEILGKVGPMTREALAEALLLSAPLVLASD